MADNEGWTVITKLKGNQRRNDITASAEDKVESPITLVHTEDELHLARKRQLKSNMFALIEVYEPPFSFLDLPRELRDIVYDVVAAELVATSLQTTEEYIAGATAAQLNINRTCKQIYVEFYERNALQSCATCPAPNCLSGPPKRYDKSYNQAVILSTARRWKLVGRLVGGRPYDIPLWDYCLCVVLSPEAPGYHFEWTPIYDSVMKAHGATPEDWETMRCRVENFLSNMIWGRERRDGIKGLSLEGIQDVVDAFYLHDIVKARKDMEALVLSAAAKSSQRN